VGTKYFITDDLDVSAVQGYFTRITDVVGTVELQLELQTTNAENPVETDWVEWLSEKVTYREAGGHHFGDLLEATTAMPCKYVRCLMHQKTSSGTCKVWVSVQKV